MLNVPDNLAAMLNAMVAVPVEVAALVAAYSLDRRLFVDTARPVAAAAASVAMADFDTETLAAVAVALPETQLPAWPMAECTAMSAAVGMATVQPDKAIADCFDTVNSDSNRPTNCNRNLEIWAVCTDRNMTAFYFCC